MLLNDRTSALRLLETRRSAKARHLVAPGPNRAEMQRILNIAARVPDHGKLAPWRFVVVDDRDALAALLQRLWRARSPDASDAELQKLADFARQAPALVILVSRPEEGRIPLLEQRFSAGAAGLALLLGATALGYAGNWLTGERAALPGLAEALGVPGGRVVGFFFLGTPESPPRERPRPAPGAIIRHWPASAGDGNDPAL